jgi:ER lumen protein retaining receptor
MRCFGFALLNYGMWTNRTAKGISVKTLQTYVVVFLARLLSILRHQGYLPFDRTGDWFYHTVEIMSLCIVMLAIYGVYSPFISTYEEKFDKFGNLKIPNEYGIAYLVGPAIVLALIFHP